VTATPETLFRCDRCGLSEHFLTNTNPPVHERMKGPDEWLVLRIGTDPATPYSHLCPQCADMFNTFMSFGRSS
jgi:hypothetical protein